MKKQYHPVKDNQACEGMLAGTYQGVLAMTVDDQRYALPLNHAYKDGRLYFHCANAGRKLDAIRANPNVAYVVNTYYGDSVQRAEAMKCHGHWESVIAYGKARVVTEPEELIRTFRMYMAHYGRGDYQHGDELLQKTNVIVIEVERMTARREYDEFRTDYWYWEPGV